MAPRFAEAVDPVGDSVNALASYIPRIGLPDNPFDLSHLANRTAQFCDAFDTGGKFDALLSPLKAVPRPKGASFWLLAAAALLLLLRCAFVCCSSRRIFDTHSQTRHLNKDL